jgi:hypothetical protein
MKKHPRLIAASIILFVFGGIQAAIYVAELIASGDRATAFLEASCVLLVGSWACGALYFYRTREARRPQKS